MVEAGCELRATGWEDITRWALAGARASGGGDESEDIAQETVVSLLRSRARWGTSVEQEGFVFTKARWLAHSLRRSEVSRRAREESWCRAVGQTKAEVKNETLASLPRELGGLAALLISGATVREMAARLSLSRSSVQRKVERLRALLSTSRFLAHDGMSLAAGVHANLRAWSGERKSGTTAESRRVSGRVRSPTAASSSLSWSSHLP